MKRFSVFLFALLFLASNISNADDSISEKLEKKYFDALDSWVNRGGPSDEVQDTVIGTCCKLVLATVDADEKVQLMTNDEEEFHFRVDACAKMTANRVYPQPELQRSETVRMICDDDSIEVFKKLCERCGLR